MLISCRWAPDLELRGFLKVKKFYFASLIFFLLGMDAVLAQTPTSVCCQQAWVTTGQSAAMTLNGLGNLAVDASTLYVPDFSNNQIQKFTLGGQPAGLLTGFLGPYSVALGPNSTLAVGEIFNGDVKLYNLAAQSVTQVLPVSGNSRSLWVDPNGDLYVTMNFNSGPGQVDIFRWTGSAYDSTAVTVSAGMGNMPTGLAKVVDGATTLLIVADAAANEVLEYTQESNYSFGLPATVTANIPPGPGQIAVDSHGDLFIGSSNNEYAAFTKTLSPLYTCNSSFALTGITLDASDDVYSAGFYDSGVGLVDEVQEYLPCLVTPTPTFAGSEICFIYPSPARGDHATVAYQMAESGRMEFKLWNQNGELVDTLTDHKPAGSQTTPFKISGFASGVYFYVLTLRYDSGSTQKSKVGKFVVLH